jgi:DHA2 family methylenomycin A resistance protein-like MFS transporter
LPGVRRDLAGEWRSADFGVVEHFVSGGVALVVPAVISLLLERAPAERAGTASGAHNASRQMGGRMAVAVLGTLVSDLTHFARGLHLSLSLGAVLLVLTTSASFSLRPPGKVR